MIWKRQSLIGYREREDLPRNAIDTAGSTKNNSFVVVVALSTGRVARSERRPRYSWLYHACKFNCMIIIWKPSVNRENCSSASACWFQRWKWLPSSKRTTADGRLSSLARAHRSFANYRTCVFVVLVSEKTNKLLIIVRPFVCCCRFIVLRWRTRHNKNVSTPSRGCEIHMNICKREHRPTRAETITLKSMRKPLGHYQTHYPI